MVSGYPETDFHVSLHLLEVSARTGHRVWHRMDMCELPRSTAPWHPHISHSSGCLQGGKKSLAVGEHSTPCFPTVPCTGAQNPPLQAPQIHTAQCRRGWISRGVPPLPHPHVSSPFTPLPTKIHRSYFFNGYLFFYMGQYRDGWGPTLGYPMLTPTQSPQGAVLVGQTDPPPPIANSLQKVQLES